MSRLDLSGSSIPDDRENLIGASVGADAKLESRRVQTRQPSLCRRGRLARSTANVSPWAPTFYLPAVTTNSATSNTRDSARRSPERSIQPGGNDEHRWPPLECSVPRNRSLLLDEECRRPLT